MKIEFEWIKELPIKQINEFEDRVVYNTAVFTREFTKKSQAFPYLSGELERQEIAVPIQEIGNKEYGLNAGVSYASRVWNYNNVNWTNPSTKPKWYYTIFSNNGETIVHQALNSALREI